jgi:hypothetical protein
VEHLPSRNLLFAFQHAQIPTCADNQGSERGDIPIPAATVPKEQCRSAAFETMRPGVWPFCDNKIKRLLSGSVNTVILLL